MLFVTQNVKKNEEKKKNRPVCLLGFKTLNRKTPKNRSNFFSQTSAETNTRESVVLTPPFFFDPSFFVCVRRHAERDDDDV